MHFRVNYCDLATRSNCMVHTRVIICIISMCMGGCSILATVICAFLQGGGLAESRVGDTVY